MVPKHSYKLFQAGSRRHRAVTLIEAVLYISIALALIVGGLGFFQQASTAAKTSATVRQLSAVVAEGRAFIKGTPLSDVPLDMTSYMISAGAVPQDMVASPTSLVNPFGGTTRIFSYLQVNRYLIDIIITGVPQGVCARLLTATSGTKFIQGGGDGGPGGTTAVSNGYIIGGAGNTNMPGGRDFIMNPTQAGWMCKYGASSYTWQNTQPTSTPLSGNVSVRMIFLGDV